MAAIKHIAIGMLIVVLLSAGLPNPSSDDANRDGRVDLSDAICNMVEFHKSSERPDIFANRMARMISALRVLAGYSSQIKPADDTAAPAGPLLIDQTYLISASVGLVSPKDYSIVPNHSSLFKSVSVAPRVPPPRGICV